MIHSSRIVRLAIGLLMAGSLTLTLNAQTDYSSRKATSRLSIGAGASIGVGIPIGTLDSNLEAAPGFAFRGGLNITYPITRTVGVFLNSGIDMRGVGKKVNGALDARSYNASYFSIEPGFQFSSLRLSLNVGLPMSISEPDSTSTSVDATVDAPSENLRMLLEPRVGAVLVLMDKTDGWLGMTIDAGFPVGPLYAEGKDKAGDIPSTRTLTAHLGVTYQFAISGL